MYGQEPLSKDVKMLFGVRYQYHAAHLLKQGYPYFDEEFILQTIFPLQPLFQIAFGEAGSKSPCVRVVQGGYPFLLSPLYQVLKFYLLFVLLKACAQ